MSEGGNLMGRPPEEALAQRFHETYERLAPDYGYETRKESAVPWADVPEQNKRLMIAVCAEILAAVVGETETPPPRCTRPSSKWCLDRDCPIHGAASVSPPEGTEP